MKVSTAGITERTCAECGKKIYPTPMWAYKTLDEEGKKYYCSWKCFKMGKYGGRIR